MQESTYAALKQVIKDRIGLDLDLYKGQQMRRRLDNFVTQHGGEDEGVWLRSLATDREELAALRDMLTINVSEFFRDFAQFETLRTKVLPDLLATRSTMSIWSAACSNGQEPYSLAITLDEMGATGRYRLLATDLDRAVLAKAQAGGPYIANDVRNVSAARKQQYFAQDGDQLFVKPALRSRVTFREHNLLADSYGANYDLIVCRNVLIYFSPEAKNEILRRFQAALKPGGVLFIGATEALLGADAKGYKALGGNFYQRTEESAVRGMVA
jgi:chemotaxis protein methyltransferase CheR